MNYQMTAKIALRTFFSFQNSEETRYWYYKLLKTMDIDE